MSKRKDPRHVGLRAARNEAQPEASKSPESFVDFRSSQDRGFWELAVWHKVLYGLLAGALLISVFLVIYQGWRIELLHEQVKSLQESQGELLGKIASLNLQVEGLQSQVKALQAEKVGDLREEIASLDTQMREVQSQIGALQEQERGNSDTIAKMQTRLEGIEAELQDVEKRLATLEEEIELFYQGNK